MKNKDFAPDLDFVFVSLIDRLPVVTQLRNLTNTDHVN
jgi:hypothetical protein